MCLSLSSCAFFYGEIDKPAQGFLHRGGRKAVSVAISLEGVYVMDSKEKVTLLRGTSGGGVHESCARGHILLFWGHGWGLPLDPLIPYSVF